MSVLAHKDALTVSAVLQIALNGETVPVGAKDLARQQDLAPRQLEAILQSLVRAKILVGVRGPNGGYHVCRPTITCGDIVRATRRRSANRATPPLRMLTSFVSQKLKTAESRYFAELDEITLADLCCEARRKGLRLATDT